jgi:hypothetical protein
MMANLVARALIAWVVLMGLANGARSHDIWTHAKEYNRPNGFPCCGGGEHTGDCEGLGADDIWDKPDGVEIYSHRYKARIFIPANRVHVDVPRDVETKQPLDELTRYEGHYCGKPRTQASYPVTPDDPDPNFHLYCFFRNAGGF